MADEHSYEELERDALFTILSETERLANVGGWEWDIPKDVWTLSDNWLRLHGCLKRHMTTSELLFIAHPDDRQDIQKAFDMAVNEGASYEIEHRIIRQDTGEVRYVRALGKPKLSGDGKTVKLFGSAQDITDKIEIEKKLRDSERRYRNLVSNLQEGIWQIDNREYTTFVNSPMAEMLGYTQAEMIGKHLFEFMDEDGKKDAATKLKNRQKGIKEQHEFEFMHKNGTIVYTLIESVPLFDNESKYIGSLASVMNISERKKVENELYDINETLKEAQSVAKIGSWWYDPVTQIPTWTEEMFYIFGLEPQPEAVPYSDHRTLIHPGDWDLFDAAVSRAVTDGIGYDLELRITLPNGEIRHINAKCKTEKDHNGRVKRLVGTTQDITDRKQKEIALKNNEKRLKLSSEFGGIGLWELSLVDYTAWRSLKHDQIFGYEALLPEWTFEIFLSHVVDEDRPMIEQKVGKALANGDTLDFECRIKRRDGLIRWISARGKCEINALQEPIKMLGTVEDITDRKKAERESLILKTAIDQAPVGIVLADENIRIYYCNPEGLGMRGGEVADLIEIPKDAFQNWQVYRLDGKSYEIDDLPLVRALKNGEVIREEFVVRHQDGRDHICDAFACPVFENNKIIGGMVIFLDITDRKRIEMKLKEKSAFLDKVIESSALSTWISDEKGTVIRTNPACLEFFGATEEEVIGKYNLFQDSVIEERGFMPDIRRVFEEGSSASIVLDYDFKAVDHVDVKRATHKIINSIFTPIFDDTGRVSNVIVQTIDLTDIKRMENELMQARKMESIGNLAGGIAHEFNNILSIIIGNNELIMEDLPERSLAKESSEEIRIAGMRARDVVKQLLTFSRLDDASRKVINLRSIVNETMKLIRSSTPANIEIQHTLADDLYPVLGNETQINQILINLCNNAVDAMPNTGGKIVVGLSNDIIKEKQKNHHVGLQSGRYVKMVISDNGIGIDGEILDRVFDPYFTTKEIGKGTGIGLAVVHGIVKRHGGSIRVESSPGYGTTFTIYLPSRENLLDDESEERAVAVTGSETILYVDDEPSIAKLGKRHLENLGYIVESTTDPLHALDMVKRSPERFDMVISDMAMPSMTGDQLIVEVLKIRPDISTIICTGYSERFSRKEATEIGIDSFIMKPLDILKFSNTIREVLDKAGR